MNASVLKEQVAELEQLTGELERTMEDVPEILVKPIFDKVVTNKSHLQEILAAVMRGGDVTDQQEEELQAKEADLTSMVEKFKALLANEPWHHPPALRDLRQTAEILTKTVSDLYKFRTRAVGPTVPAAGRRGPLVAPAMAGKKDSADAKSMTVTEALKQICGARENEYTGGYTAFIHAAGVQELVPFTSHSPGKYEFLFSPKGQALWNFHAMSATV